MLLRKMHRAVGVLSAPFLLLTAVAGALLLLRRTGLYGFGARDVILGLHNWEIIAGYIGVVLALALAFMAVTGFLIFLKMKLRRKKKVKQPR